MSSVFSCAFASSGVLKEESNVKLIRHETSFFFIGMPLFTQISIALSN
jgi:hypothetical protein